MRNISTFIFNSKLILILTSFLFITINIIYPQSPTVNGLLFNDHFNSSLNLTSEKAFKLDEVMKLEFELALDSKTYSGNLFYLGDSEKFSLHFNLINYRDQDTSYLNMFLNQKETGISFPLVKRKLDLYKWEKFIIVLDIKAEQILVHYKDLSFALSYKIPKGVKLNLIFGNPPPRKHLMGLNSCHFALRDLSIFLGESFKYDFKFDEINGDYAYEENGKFRAKQTDCEWLLTRTVEWKKLESFSSDEHPGIAYDSVRNIIYLVNHENLIKFYTNEEKYERIQFLENRPQRANVAIYNNFTNELFAYHSGLGEVSVYDEEKRMWSSIDTSQDTLKHYYVHVPFIDVRNGDLYALGGYGWYKAKNDLQKYDFQSKKWKKIKLKGDFFSPRSGSYIAKSKNDHEYYIFGGIGNNSGRQEEGFIPLHELFVLNLKNYTIKKLWEGPSDFSPRNVSQYSGSLILDKDNEELYLILKDEISDANKPSNINLYSCSINKGTITKLSLPLPTYENYRGYNLFRNNKNNRLYLTIIQTDPFDKSKKREIYIYSLFYPPQSFENLANLQKEKEKKYSDNFEGEWYSSSYFKTLVTVFGLLAFYLVIRSKSKKKKRISKTFSELNYVFKNSGLKENYISVFSEFLVFDKDGKDITSKFNPKLKELFLFILINSLYKTNGNLTTPLLTTTLWPDLNNNEAKNIRGVTIHRLRELLGRLDKIELIYKNKKWYLEIYPPLIIDFKIYLELSEVVNNGEIAENIVKMFITVIKQEGLLPSISYQWLDGIKYTINSKIISDCKKLIEFTSQQHLDELTIELCDIIFSIDPVYESALAIKITALQNLGHYGFIKETYNQFCKNYEDLYNEPFQHKMEEFTNKN